MFNIHLVLRDTGEDQYPVFEYGPYAKSEAVRIAEGLGQWLESKGVPRDYFELRIQRHDTRRKTLETIVAELDGVGLLRRLPTPSRRVAKQRW